MTLGDLQGYVLVTPARNEEAHIEKTIEAVLSQTIQPRRWVIVSDGSVDRTDEIVARYARSHAIIQLVRSAKQGQRNFGSKTKAFEVGYQQLKDIPHGFLGNLDADVSFAANYYEQILQQFQIHPYLGIGGGIILELINNQFVPQRISLNSVAGAIQLFRRQCYQAIGGYIPIPTGGIDAAAEILARKHGWGVQTFAEIPVYHHRRVTTGRASVLRARFYQGVTNYTLGYHPLFQTMSCLYRVAQRPYVVVSAFTLFGYVWSCLKRSRRVLPDEVIRYLRSEQMARMARFFLAGKTQGKDLRFETRTD